MIRLLCASLALALAAGAARAAPPPPAPPPLLYGVAYYEEYEPVDRLAADVAMMKAAHISVVRIGESTWGTMETAPGVFDFHHIDRVLDAMGRAGIHVIVGTPTYAIPAWLAKAHPEVLAVTPSGQNKFGGRQNMDITAPAYRVAADRVTRALVAHVAAHPAVIGYQVDNETKYYDTAGPNVQAAFVEHLQRRFGGSLDAMNLAFGLNYWSNRINRWDEFPSTLGTVNASITGAFDEFRRGLVTEFLAEQAGIVRSLKRPDQFITQNFDMDWGPTGTNGVQPAVNHFDAARAMDVAGVDIYHGAGAAYLTGNEIAFGGDLARSLKGGAPYLVMETQAQGERGWLPYPGQLRLQAFSHLASGARMVEYWHWAATANGLETYWRGLLGQDYAPGRVYAEATAIGADFARLGPRLAGLRKDNRIALYVSNRALTAFDQFPLGDKKYNDVMRPWYDALYRMNAETDIVDASATDLSRYKLIVVPALYAASDAEIARLTAWARGGGHLVVTFRSGFSDENVKVRYAAQPGGFAEAAGVRYEEYTVPDHAALAGIAAGTGDVRWWMELLEPAGAGTQVLARYDHPVWGRYAAITRHAWGRGEVEYIGTMPSDAGIAQVMEGAVKDAGLWGAANSLRWPLVTRGGKTPDGRVLHYLLNFSDKPAAPVYPFAGGTELLGGGFVAAGQPVALGAWGVAIVEEHAR